MDVKTFFKTLWEYMVLILGGILLGIALEYVLVPLKITTGGFSGLATIAYYLLEIPIEIALVLLNVPAFLITWKVLGLKFGIRSFVGMLACSLGAILGKSLGTLTTDFMLAALYGGILSGVGVALTYKMGGSTGGTDIVAKLITSKAKHINVGEALLIVDGIIIMFLTIVFKNIEIGLYSIVSAFIMAKVIDLMLIGGGYAKAMFVITKKGEEISKYVHSELERTSTKINAVGTYTNENREILLCVVNKKEIPKLKEAINEIDPESFVIVTAVAEAIGEGFKKVE